MLIALIAFIAGLYDKIAVAVALFLIAVVLMLLAESNILGTLGDDRPIGLYRSQVAMVLAQNATIVFVSFLAGLICRSAWRALAKKR